MNDIASDTVRQQIVQYLPNLRAFARSLTRDSASADDLVQEALVRAFGNLDKFKFGTNLKAWLFMILRNVFFNELRYQKSHGISSIEDAPEAAQTAHVASQHDSLELKEVLRAIYKLTPEHREILILIAAEGLSYEEAAEICGCPVGTIKSRLSRARSSLLQFWNSPQPLSHPRH